MSNTTQNYDVLVIGGGPAGLETALGLGRQLYSVVVFDSRQYRNYPVDHMHNVITWDHKAPSDFRATAQAQIQARYKTVQFHNAEVQSIRKTDDGKFEAVDQYGQTFSGKKVVVASGVKDLFPDIKGYGECWGKAIFHCLFCHGFEEQGGPSAGVLAVGMLADPKFALHMARMAAPLAKSITLYTNGVEVVTEDLTTAMKGKRVQIESRKIENLELQSDNSGVIVHFDDKTSKKERFLGHIPSTSINGSFIEQLGLELTEQGTIKTVSPVYETTVSGVFAAGDCATPLRSVTQAMAIGTCCSGGVAAQLSAELL